jgi:hypothetical protein
MRRILWGIWRRLWVRNGGWPSLGFLSGALSFKWNFLVWWFRDLLRFFVKSGVQIVVFGVVKMDMLW